MQRHLWFGSVLRKFLLKSTHSWLLSSCAGLCADSSLPIFLRSSFADVHGHLPLPETKQCNEPIVSETFRTHNILYKSHGLRDCCCCCRHGIIASQHVNHHLSPGNIPASQEVLELNRTPQQRDGACNHASALPMLTLSKRSLGLAGMGQRGTGQGALHVPERRWERFSLSLEQVGLVATSSLSSHDGRRS